MNAYNKIMATMAFRIIVLLFILCFMFYEMQNKHIIAMVANKQHAINED